jgi:hypothetical protein
LLTTSKSDQSNIGKGFMTQTAISRQGQAKPPAYWETIRDRINAGKAVEIVNKALDEQDVKQSALNTALFVINKLLPSPQAVMVEITHKTASSVHDLRARAESLGLDPNLLLSQPIDSINNSESVVHTQEKSIVPDTSIGAPIPPVERV